MTCASLSKIVTCIHKRPSRFIATLSLGLLCGCTHFHNPKNEELAKDALKDFNEFKKTSGGPYGTMLRNHAKMDVASAAFQAEVAKVKAAVITAGVAGKTWSEIKKDLEKAQATHQQRSEALAKELETLAGQASGAKESTKRIEEALKKAQKDLADAFSEQQKWEARQALFLSAIKISAEMAGSTNKPDADALKKAGKDALDQEIIVERFNDKGEMVTITNKASDILKGDADTIRDGLVGDLLAKYTYKLFDPDSAPGLKVVIFSLGVDLAKQQLERAKLEVAYLREKIALGTERQRLLVNSESISSATALQILEDRAEKAKDFGDVGDSTLKTAESLRADKSKDKELQDAFTVMATLTYLKTLHESRWEESSTRAAFLEHQRSIKLSAINAAEHEALISRGLQGLVIYHQGGLTEERIANFIRLVQTVAVAYIGTAVD